MSATSLRLQRARPITARRWLRVAWRRSSPPFRRREFWTTQLLVFLIAGSHAVLELMPSSRGDHLEVVPVSLFLIPVVYAGLNFGLRGAGPTALWCAGLTVPNVLFLHGDAEQFTELWQAGVVIIVGLLVGHRIDRERRARAEAERREHARRASEERYRTLFGSTADPILLLRSGEVIEEANEAAARMLGIPGAELSGRTVESVAGAELAAAVRDKSVPLIRLVHAEDGPRWLQPVVAVFGRQPGRTQVVLRDITVQQERQEGLEAYTRQTLVAREEERRRIARDLHDGPVQELVLLWRNLDELGERVTAENRPRLVEARGHAERIANDLRRFSRELRPSLLDDLGLGPALNAECAVFSLRSGVAARYEEAGEPRRLPTDVELMLLRIAQEALHNVERHARARRAVVQLAYRGTSTRLTITDNGCGFTPPSDNRSLLADGKLGVVGMRERARLAGGELTIRSARNRRTSVSVVVPG